MMMGCARAEVVGAEAVEASRLIGSGTSLDGSGAPGRGCGGTILTKRGREVVLWQVRRMDLRDFLELLGLRGLLELRGLRDLRFHPHGLRFWMRRW